MNPRRDWPEAALAVAALGAVLCGIGWGLPGAGRITRLAPPAGDGQDAFYRRMAQGRERLYREMEGKDRLPVDGIESAVLVPSGWTEVPEPLLNSYRSYYLRSSNPDEQKNLAYLSRMRPREFDFEPFGIDYGGAYLYPLGAYYAALAAARIVRVTGDLPAYFEVPERMARVFEAGRLFNGLCFIACAFVLWELARRRGSRAAGRFSAALFLSLPVVQIVGHTLNPYGWATLWSLLAVLCLERYFDEEEPAALWAAGACIGMSVGSSFAFWPLGLLTAAPFFRQGALEDKPESAVRAAQAVAVAGVVFTASNPYLFLRFEHFAGQLVYLMRNNPAEPSLAGLRSFVFEFLVLNWGWTPAIVGVAAAAAAVARPARASDRLYALVFFAGLAHLGTRVVDFPHGRHLLPFFAMGSWFAGEWIWREIGKTRAVLAAAASLALLLDAGSTSVSYLANFSREASGDSTRYAASDWFVARVPPKSRVGLLAPPQFSDTPPIPFDRYDLVVFMRPEHLGAVEPPEYILAAESRASGPLRPWIEERYDVQARFGPRRLFPWVAVRGIHSFANLEMAVYKLKGDRSK